MTFITRFILFQLMIVIPFAVGTFSRRRSAGSQQTTKQLIRLNLIFIEPFIVLWSIWGIELSRELFLLPVSGVFLVLAGGLMGLVIAPVLRLERRSGATFKISASLANHGFTMGGFLCYLFMGEEGLGISFIFLSYFMIYLFLVIFPYAGLASGERNVSIGWVRDFFLNLRNMPLYAVFAAIGLQLGGVSRPQIFFPIDLLMLISIAIYYYTVGINFSLGGRLKYWAPNLALAVIKFILVPLAAFGLLQLVPLSGIPARVIMLQAFMPAETYSVVSAVLFDLDSELASNMFVFNTLFFLIVVLPLLIFVGGF